jgi:heat shock protein HslJ
VSRRAALFTLLAALSLTAQAEAELLRGRVSLPPGAALPPTASLRLELFDVSGTAMRRLSLLEQPTAARPLPLAFMLPYEAPATAPVLALRGVVYADGQVLFVSRGVQRIAGDGGNTPIELLLASPHGDSPEVASLTDTDWQLVDVGGAPARAQPGERTAYLVLLDGLLTGGSGCNKLMGSYVSDRPGKVRFGPVASTRMACAEAMQAQETALLNAFAHASAYRIEGRTLTLLHGDRVLARFFARALP